MAIVVAVPTHAGPGYVCTISGMTGPTPLDDRVTFGVRAPVSGNFLTAGNTLTLGATFLQVILGVTEVGTVADALDEYVPPGTSVSVDWFQQHADDSVVDSGTVTGILWDPTGGAYQLTQLLLQRGAGGGVLDQVLAAVKRTYP